MVNSGLAFYNRYIAVSQQSAPFIRASGVGRVLESAKFFSKGFHLGKSNDNINDTLPYDILVIGEYPGSNNTLNHGLCTMFETEPLNLTGKRAQMMWQTKHIPPIKKRVSSHLRGANLSDIDVLNLMDLCPFETVASPNAVLPPFCQLFTYEEWRKYDYFQGIGKYYGYGTGNMLGPTQGVGFVNELVARMTNSGVRDMTSVNQTLDSNPATFPLGLPLYADFSHDNDMTSIFFALGLYDSLPSYGKDNDKDVQSGQGYSASTTVPFAARAYVEKMACGDSQEELVRVVVNNRVVPLQNCDADGLGRCRLGKFVESLGFARKGGKWEKCFEGNATLRQ
jgi:hypothetical protein